MTKKTTKQDDTKTLKERDFRLSARDDKGHGDRFQFQAPSAYKAQALEIIASKQFPFRFAGDLYRWAVRRGIDYLLELSKELDGARIPSVTAQIDIIDEICTNEEFNREMLGAIERSTAQINTLFGKGDRNEARRRYLAIQRSISEMPDGYWKTEMDKRLTEDCDYVLSEGKASLIKGDSEE